MQFVSPPSRVRRIALVALLTLLPVLALAEEFQETVKQLKASTDFRVRTQAALTLGASGRFDAIRPLCDGLGDENRTVRIASATALTRLNLGGVRCLRDHKKSEKDEAVVSSIDRALGVLDDAVPVGAKTKFYVAIDRLSGPERLDGTVRSAFVRSLRSRGEMGIAPREEAADAAEKELKKNKSARGVLLAIKALKPKYEQSQLEIKLQIAILSYPGRSVVADYSQKVTAPDVTQPDPKLEEELVVTSAEAAAERFAKLIPTLDI